MTGQRRHPTRTHLLILPLPVELSYDPRTKPYAAEARPEEKYPEEQQPEEKYPKEKQTKEKRRRNHATTHWHSSGGIGIRQYASDAVYQPGARMCYAPLFRARAHTTHCVSVLTLDALGFLPRDFFNEQ
jgi:hypothetical protein